MANRFLAYPPPPSFPVISEGTGAATDAWFHLPPTGAANGTLALTLSRCYFLPFVVPRDTKVRDITVNVTTAGAAGALLRVGLYASDGFPTYRPGSLLVDDGTVVSTATGVKTWNISPNQAVTEGTVYYVAVVAQTVTCTCRTRQSSNPLVPTGIGANDPGAAIVSAYYISGVTGALPASAGAVAGVTQGPDVGLRFAA